MHIFASLRPKTKQVKKNKSQRASKLIRCSEFYFHVIAFSFALLLLFLLNSFCILLHPLDYSIHTDYGVYQYMCAHCTHGHINKLQCPNNKNEWTLRSRLLYLMLFTLNIIFDCNTRLLKHKTSSWLSVHFICVCCMCMCKRNLYVYKFCITSDINTTFHRRSSFYYILMQLTLNILNGTTWLLFLFFWIFFTSVFIFLKLHSDFSPKIRIRNLNTFAFTVILFQNFQLNGIGILTIDSEISLEHGKIPT